MADGHEVQKPKRLLVCQRLHIDKSKYEPERIGLQSISPLLIDGNLK